MMDAIVLGFIREGVPPVRVNKGILVPPKYIEGTK
jgi:hypothetical protein